MIETTFTLESDPWGRLVLVLADGTRHPGAEPVLAFPITDPGGPVAFLADDGRELLAVPRLDALPAAHRERLDLELAKRHFLPVITRVNRLTGRTDPVEWDVETDRGPVRFSVAGEEEIRRLSGGRVLITDTAGRRYLIPNLNALSADSRRQLARYL